MVCDSISINVDRKLSKTKKDLISNSCGADFETAISATKFGKFNILLFLLSIPAGWTSMLGTTTMSYVFPAAHCDLDLSLNERGSLNAITFVGMVSSGFIWGFLCDTFGRKKIMVAGYLLDGAFGILTSFSQNYTFLLIFKFFGGFIINGPFAALTAYLSEFHCSKYRSRVQLIRGMIVSCGTLTLPLVAWAILPQSIEIEVFTNNIVLHSWNIFLLVCSIPSLISGIVFMLMPESPKFLMSCGHNKEALTVFQKVYRLNTGEKEFPITTLFDETTIRKVKNTQIREGVELKPTKNQIVKEAILQIKPICFPPHLKNIFLVCLMQSMFMLSVNTLRLWAPQIYQSISDYQYYNNGTTSSLCVMLGALKPSEELDLGCYVNFSPSVYTNTMIMSGVTICGYILASSFINRIGKKTLLSILSIGGGLCGISIYFSQNTITVIALSSLVLGMGSICANLIMTIVIDLFPTTLRAVAISIVMIMGRTASMIGNLLFPLLLSLGCAPPFFTIGCTIIVCSLLTWLLPNTDLKALK